MKIYFERNNSGLTYLEIDEDGLVIMCNNHIVWGEYWIGCMVADPEQLSVGEFLSYLDPRSGLKKTPFKVVEIKD